VSHDAVALYHRLTSYEPPWQNWETPKDHPLIRQDLKQNDPATQPPPVKRYPQKLETVALPREWPAVEISAGDALAGRVPDGGAARRGRLDVAALARILHLSAGVVRTTQRPGRPLFLFRAAGSAGGRFAMELYVAARDVDGLADGVWWYDPQGHALRRVGPPAADGGTTVIVTGVPWRTGWRYAERGYRHLYWDSGTMLAQLLALAATAGLQPRLYTRFPDARVAALVGADGVHELPLELVALGGGAPATDAGGAAERGEIDDEPQEYPLITATQRAGDLDELGTPWPDAPAVQSRPTPPLDEVILTRGSTRLMDRGATVPRDLLEWPLTAALRGIDVPHFVAVHAVEGIAPGVYRWPDLDQPVNTELTRDGLAHISMDQDLGGDAAYVVIAAHELDSLNARGYREAQLAAGLVEGRLHLAAYGLGIGASGMTFFDSEIPGLLGSPLAGLIFTCVGVPEYRSKPGGKPGQATAVRVPTPRMDD
jgi:SagB-type dehydrogenase family enzyme